MRLVYLLFLNSVLPWEDLTFNVLDRFFETKKVDLHDLFHLHRGLFNNINKIKAVLSKKVQLFGNSILPPSANTSLFGNSTRTNSQLR